jgi:hypothetical protein
VDPAAGRSLREAEELELVTRGRVSGRAHVVRLRFAYDDGTVWLRTDRRPPPADATGVSRATAAQTSDWLRNLEHDGEARVRIGDLEFAARYEPSTDPKADLRRAVGLLREKYGPEWVADWYLDSGRIPVKLRIAA